MDRFPLRVLFLSPWLLALGCGVVPNDRADLASNELLYVDVPFATKAPGDREVFVAPVADARDLAALPTKEKGFPIVYGGDEFWERPVREMLADVLRRQLEQSQLFGQVVDRPSPSSLVLKPVLVTFTTGATEAMSGRRTFAEVGLRLTVLGPADAGGRRVTLLEQTYGSRQLSEVELNPVSPYRLVGRALQQSMGKLLAGLDGSNVGRSDVPLEAAVEAAAPR
ncbi:MAG: hypothetical protein KF830_00105 [Planctomycetes bacterium]|nr:hypothetical protein [Planctomycetota bacterium]